MGKMPPLHIITLPSLVTIDNAMADMSLWAEGQDYACSLKSAITVYFWSTWHESTWHVILISPALVISFLGNKCWNIAKKTFASSLLKVSGEIKIEKEKLFQNFLH